MSHSNKTIKKKRGASSKSKRASMTAAMREGKTANAAIVPCSGLEEQSDYDLILSRFEDVAVSRKVVKLGMEDLILSASANKQILKYKAESVIFANDRTWEKVLFTDSVHARDFHKWQEGAATMMRDYESFGAHLPSSKLRNALVWKAVVTVKEGTPVEELLKLLDQIKSSTDLVSVSINPEGCTACATAEDVVNLIGWKQRAGTMGRKTFVTVQFRWPTFEIAKQLRGHRPAAFLTCCIFMIKAMRRNMVRLEEAQSRKNRDKHGALLRRQSARPRLQSSRGGGIRGLLAMSDSDGSHSEDDEEIQQQLQNRRAGLQSMKSCPRLIAAGERRAAWKGNMVTDSYRSLDAIHSRPAMKRSPSCLEVDSSDDDDKPEREHQRRRSSSRSATRTSSCRSLKGLLADAAHLERRRGAVLRKPAPQRAASTLSLQAMVQARVNE